MQSLIHQPLQRVSVRELSRLLHSPPREKAQIDLPIRCVELMIRAYSIYL